ncbi:hypothetical protein LBMAG42_57420 [Deltaproteobacteria bacterium]|nr:hypothetical protein LBMAG42_57420 [Deltaproteobacteria bacterium]
MNDTPPFFAPVLVPFAEPERVRNAMKTVAEDGPEELVFDPSTGRVTVVRRGAAPVNDALPATIVARSGFFAGGRS